MRVRVNRGANKYQQLAAFKDNDPPPQKNRPSFSKGAGRAQQRSEPEVLGGDHGRWHGGEVHVHLCAVAGQWDVASDGGAATL